MLLDLQQITLREFKICFCGIHTCLHMTQIQVEEKCQNTSLTLEEQPQSNNIRGEYQTKCKLRQIDMLMTFKRRLIQECSSPWSSPVVLVKKNDGTTRFRVDYRKPNNVTIKDAYSLPRIDDSLDQPVGNKYFSTLHLNAGYWQIRWLIRIELRLLQSFKVMQFGLCNALATFEGLMKSVLRALQWHNVWSTLTTFSQQVRLLTAYLLQLDSNGKKKSAISLRQKKNFWDTFSLQREQQQGCNRIGSSFKCFRIEEIFRHSEATTDVLKKTLQQQLNISMN